MDVKKIVFNFRGSCEKYNQVKFNHSEWYKVLWKLRLTHSSGISFPSKTDVSQTKFGSP